MDHLVITLIRPLPRPRTMTAKVVLCRILQSAAA